MAVKIRQFEFNFLRRIKDDMESKNSKLATATVTMDGLAICCYVLSKKIWDVGFLRVEDPPHNLTLKINGADIDVSSARLIRIAPVIGDVLGGNGEYPSGCHDGGKVDRHGTKNPDNMRWTLDINNPADVVQDNLELQKPSCPVTRLQVSGAIFRCAGLFPLESKALDMYRVPNGKDPNKIPPGELKKYRLGKTNDLVAGDISSADALTVQIEIDGQTLDYDVTPDKPLLIEFQNMDYKPDLPKADLYKGDFHLYYDAIKNATQEYALWGPARPIKDPKDLMFDFRTDCNAVWVSEAENIDVLFA